MVLTYSSLAFTYETDTKPLIRATLDPDMFPKTWTDERADALKETEIEESRELIEAELEKYPPALIKKTLSRIYIVDTLYKGQLKQGGTNSLKNIYLETKNPEKLHCQITSIFHAEYSSILLRNYSDFFPMTEWTSQNPSGFTYFGKNGNKAIQAGHASSATYTLAEIRENGGAFISEYAQADAEDDFNSIAKRLFNGSRMLWAAYDKKDLKIKAKVDILIKFYNSVDKKFDYDFFKNIPECK
jgi:hypothetical protein